MLPSNFLKHLLEAQHAPQCFNIASNLSECNRKNNLMHLRMNWGEGWHFLIFFEKSSELQNLHWGFGFGFFFFFSSLLLGRDSTDWLNVSTELVSQKSLISWTESHMGCRILIYLKRESDWRNAVQYVHTLTKLRCQWLDQNRLWMKNATDAESRKD